MTDEQQISFLQEKLRDLSKTIDLNEKTIAESIFVLDSKNALIKDLQSENARLSLEIAKANDETYKANTRIANVSKQLEELMKAKR